MTPNVEATRKQIDQIRHIADAQRAVEADEEVNLYHGQEL